MLKTIPGVSRLSAELIVSEIGVDMSRFLTEGDLISGPDSAPRTTKAPEDAAPRT
jgi:transposase